jgi:hypothetical protein
MSRSSRCALMLSFFSASCALSSLLFSCSGVWKGPGYRVPTSTSSRSLCYSFWALLFGWLASGWALQSSQALQSA